MDCHPYDAATGIPDASPKNFYRESFASASTRHYGENERAGAQRAAREAARFDPDAVPLLK
jgi:hypothetical protein